MITREAWDKMTPQQQFDYARLLEDTVDDFAEADARITDMAHQVLLNMHADSDLLHGMVEVKPSEMRSKGFVVATDNGDIHYPPDDEATAMDGSVGMDPQDYFTLIAAGFDLIPPTDETHS